ncbi:probable cytochrome P450 28c1 [Drosophila subobscura]|uniref:probable cytochrome P450 28c1 n=1 Tax=Drosophila subobscura TaxID=7241 RepID=UPI00155A06AA|nr:probable cytochrome P450 28c1 [Drosophila subobscura]
MIGSLLLAVCTFGALLYGFLVWNFGHWRRRGVREPRALPLLGSFPNMVWPRQHFTMDMRDLYMKYRETDSYIGTYLLRSPKLLLLEPRLVYEVFVSAFRHFEDNDAARMVDTGKDVLVCCNPFVLLGNEWRQQRAIFSSLLTNGRIRTTHAIMQRVCRDLCDFIGRESLRGEPQDGMDLGLRFTGDSLFDCVLGIQARCFSDSPLPVIRHNREMSNENPGLAIAGALNGLFPRLPRWLRPKIFPRSYDRFFGDLIQQAFRLRRGQHQERNDFINHLLALKREHGLTEPQLTSHAMTFMFDGLDTTSSTISHCLLLLGRYPECQQRLCEELDKASPTKELPDLDALNDLPYLSACFNESLRIYPAGGWASKTCTEAYKLQGSHHSQPLQMLPGDNIMIPIYGLHHDPQFYPEPEEFRPERFLDGGLKRYKQMGVFLGFGNGPRQCVGMRLGLAQAKAALAAIVQRFEVRVNPRTADGLELDPYIFVGCHKGGIWLDFVARQL